MDSVIEIEVSCAICNTKDILKTVLSEMEHSAQLNWKCPTCGAERTTIIRKDETETKEVEKKEEKRYRYIDGKRTEVDADGKPLNREKKVLATTKKKKDYIPYSTEVGRI